MENGRCIVAILGVDEPLSLTECKVVSNDPVRQALGFETPRNGVKSLPIRVCSEVLRVSRINQIPGAELNRVASTLGEVECETVGFGDRVIVETAILDRCQVVIQVLLHAQSVACDTLQVRLETGEHMDASSQAVHAPILLDRGCSSAYLETSEYRQLIRLHEQGLEFVTSLQLRVK